MSRWSSISGVLTGEAVSEAVSEEDAVSIVSLAVTGICLGFRAQAGTPHLHSMVREAMRHFQHGLRLTAQRQTCTTPAHSSRHIRRGFTNSMWTGCIFTTRRIAKCLCVQFHARHSKAHRCPLLAHCHVELLQLICQAPPTEQGAKWKAPVWGWARK
jgi:hypothetical protein